jgi:hypothetical protein
MNVNHEYWHLRENDPTSPNTGIGAGPESVVDIKFSFGNFLDDDNEIQFGAARRRRTSRRFASKTCTGWTTWRTIVSRPRRAGTRAMTTSGGRSTSSPIGSSHSSRKTAARQLPRDGTDKIIRTSVMAPSITPSARCACRTRVASTRRSSTPTRWWTKISWCWVTESLRVRHVDHAVQLVRQPGAHARRAGAPTFRAPHRFVSFNTRRIF